MVLPFGGGHPSSMRSQATSSMAFSRFRVRLPHFRGSKGRILTLRSIVRADPWVTATPLRRLVTYAHSGGIKLGIERMAMGVVVSLRQRSFSKLLSEPESFAAPVAYFSLKTGASFFGTITANDWWPQHGCSSRRARGTNPASPQAMRIQPRGACVEKWTPPHVHQHGGARPALRDHRFSGEHCHRSWIIRVCFASAG